MLLLAWFFGFVTVCEAFVFELRENIHIESRALSRSVRLLLEQTFGGVAASGTSGAAACGGSATLE